MEENKYRRDPRNYIRELQEPQVESEPEQKAVKQEDPKPTKKAKK